MRWFERALALLDEAADDGDPAVRCDLQIGLGQAKRQLADPGFREALLEASRLARDLGDADRMTTAVLANTRGQVSALGRIDQEKVEMIEAALELVPETEPARRARLLSAQAMELNFERDHTHRRALVDEALVLAERSGDERARAHVLHHSCLSIQRPDTIDERRAMVAEMRSLAERFGDPELRFWSQWLATHEGEAGDFEEVDRCLAAAWANAEEIGQPGLLWTCLFAQSCRVRVAARLGEAEALAARAGRMSEPDAGMLFAGQTVGLRWEQGRSAEIVDLVVQAHADNPGISGFRPMTAVVLADVGRHDDARALLDAAAREGFDAVPRDNVWSTTLALWAQVVHDLGAAEHARPLYDELAPWCHMIVWNAAVSYNSIDHYLGGLAAVLGDHDLAVRHFEGAIATAERIPAPLWLARTLLWYGRLTADAGDPERARDLLRRSATLAREHGGARVERDALALMVEGAPR
jgi:tetratricopeptide (TPR) repeat protein